LTRVIEIDPSLTFFYVLHKDGVVVVLDELTMIAYLERGSVYLAMHDTQKAIADFAEVLSRQSESVLRAVRVNALAAAYYGRARAHAEGKVEDRAIADLERRSGRAHLSLQAGRTFDGMKFVDQPLPSGTRPRPFSSICVPRRCARASAW
jgi:hypothetical protein